MTASTPVGPPDQGGPRPVFSDSMTIAEARARLQGLRVAGHTCPVCEQFAKVYRRKISSTTARLLIQWHRQHGTRWCRPIDFAGKNSPDLVKARYWGLIARVGNGRREDGSDRTGWWRLTESGSRFVQMEQTVRKYVYLYNGEVVPGHGPEAIEFVTIRECLGSRFDYSELMGGV